MVRDLVDSRWFARRRPNEPPVYRLPSSCNSTLGGAVTRSRKLLIGVGLAAVTYTALLLVLGWVLEGVVETRVKEQLEYTLRANEISVADVDVSLVRGRVVLRGVKAKRSGLGTASLTIDVVELDIARMGWALVDQEPSRLELVGAHLDLSAAGVATLQSSDVVRQLSVGRFIMRDSKVTLAVTSLFPGLGQAELVVDEAQAQDVELHNAMSWLYKTQILKARLNLPGSTMVVVGYADEMLTVGGSLMGSKPVVIPFVWPKSDPTKLELSQILSLAKTLIKALGPELAKRKVNAVWDDVVDAF